MEQVEWEVKGLLKWSLLGFLLKSNEPNAQRSQGNWYKVTQLEGTCHGVYEYWLLTSSVCFPVIICLIEHILSFFLLPPSYQSFFLFDPQQCFTTKAGSQHMLG